MRDKKFAIIGGGIGGLTLAIALQQNGFEVSVYENAPVLKPLGAGLILAANAIKAFHQIGIEESVLASGRALKVLRIKDQDGNILNEVNSEKLTAKLGFVNTFTIHRADLHAVLAGHLRPGTIHTNKGCVDYFNDGAKVILQFHDGSSTEADYVVAADGIHSMIRKKLLPETYPRYAGYTCWRAVIDHIPADVNMEETSETWGKGKRFGIVPLSGNRIYWFACINAGRNDLQMQQMNIDDLKRTFSGFHFSVGEILNKTTDSQLIWNDIIDIRPLKKFAFGNIVLIGDAAHATTPNMGQGACLAIEDAAVLANCLLRYPAAEAFTRFEQKRIQRTTRIVNQSWRFGQIAQLENPLLVRVRNFAMRTTPESIMEKQLNFIAGASLH